MFSSKFTSNDFKIIIFKVCQVALIFITNWNVDNTIISNWTFQTNSYTWISIEIVIPCLGQWLQGNTQFALIILLHSAARFTYNRVMICSSILITLQKDSGLLLLDIFHSEEKWLETGGYRK